MWRSGVRAPSGPPAPTRAPAPPRKDPVATALRPIIGRPRRVARLRAIAPALLALALVLGGCRGDDAASPTSTETPTATATSSLTPTAETPTATRTVTATASPTATATPLPEPQPVTLVPVFDGRAFDRPLELGAYLPGIAEAEGFFVAQQDGVVLLLTDGGESVLLDISDRVNRGGNEQGLLSVVLDPAFAENGHLWVLYSERPDGGTRLSRFRVDLERDPLHADPDSELEIFTQAQPRRNHNGGSARFGPDGMLYVGLGDGGGAGDPQGNGQSLATILGSVLRIDVRNASEAQPYAIPPDNPFVDSPGARGEIWAYGLRNPWRMSFDPDTGRLWLADVGQERIEEVDVIERGGNYGWSRMEGSSCYEPPANCEEDAFGMPVAEYSHADGCSISGGVVYRGSDVPSLVGSYVYGDYCSAKVWALPPGGGEPVQIAEAPAGVSSFGVDADGEVYVVTFGAGILKIAP